MMAGPAGQELLRVEGVGVRLGGRDILRDVALNGGPRPRRGGRLIGYVPQKLAIDPDMPLRARDVVALGIDGHKLGFPLPSAARRGLVTEALRAVRADGFADARVGELSGGEQQRVLIAHAVISRPRLLLDEPLANLDLRSDVATGVVLGAALGAAALFLYLGTQTSSTTGASFTILFGSMFVITPDTVPALIASGLLALAVVAVLSRVLLLTALSPEIAAARGVRVRAAGIAYLAALAVAVSLSSVAIGAVLSTGLLIGPAATALRIARNPGRTMATAALTGTAATWPVSFFVVALVVIGYLLSYARLPGRKRPGGGRRAGTSEEQEVPACSPA